MHENDWECHLEWEINCVLMSNNNVKSTQNQSYSIFIHNHCVTHAFLCERQRVCVGDRH